MLVQTLENDYGTKQLYLSVLIGWDAYTEFSLTGRFRIDTTYVRDIQHLYLEVQYDKIFSRWVPKKVQDYTWIDQIKTLFGGKVYDLEYYTQPAIQYVNENSFIFREHEVLKETFYSCNS